MITTHDDPIGYTDDTITERLALALLHEMYPTATLEPVPGNPNILGMNLFKVFDRPSGIPRLIYVTADGRTFEVDNNIPLTT